MHARLALLGGKTNEALDKPVGSDQKALEDTL